MLDFFYNDSCRSAVPAANSTHNWLQTWRRQKASCGGRSLTIKRRQCSLLGNAALAAFFKGLKLRLFFDKITGYRRLLTIYKSKNTTKTEKDSGATHKHQLSFWVVEKPKRDRFCRVNNSSCMVYWWIWCKKKTIWVNYQATKHHRKPQGSRVISGHIDCFVGLRVLWHSFLDYPISLRSLNYQVSKTAQKHVLSSFIFSLSQITTS